MRTRNRVAKLQERHRIKRKKRSGAVPTVEQDVKRYWTVGLVVRGGWSFDHVAPPNWDVDKTSDGLFYPIEGATPKAAAIRAMQMIATGEVNGPPFMTNTEFYEQLEQKGNAVISEVDERGATIESTSLDQSVARITVLDIPTQVLK